MIQIGLVPPDDIERHEDLLKPFIARMDKTAPGQWSWEYVRDEVADEALHLWFAMMDGELVMLVGCRLDALPGGRKFYDVIFAAGSRVGEVFNPMMDRFDEIAALEGASVRIPMGRPGWSKLMRARGMKPTAYCYERVV